jgi:hypothetical protein
MFRYFTMREKVLSIFAHERHKLLARVTVAVYHQHARFLLQERHFDLSGHLASALVMKTYRPCDRRALDELRSRSYHCEELYCPNSLIALIMYSVSSFFWSGSIGRETTSSAARSERERSPCVFILPSNTFIL